ncbi:MAG: DUF885 family protein [Acidimicrobiales bacterium]|nr:DUF885 family protein [Acidimicrobiales bacterium]
MRGNVGLHEYDGRVQDLSPSGVRAALAALGGPAEADPFDDALLDAAEAHLRVTLGDLALHRRSPLLHLENLDVSGYQRPYAPADERRAARRRHLAAWPDAIDAAIEALDAVPAPVAAGLLPAVKGLAEGVDANAGAVEAAAAAAHARFAAHVERCATEGDPDAALGGPALVRLLSTAEAVDVDLGRLAVAADAERDRLRSILTESCRALCPDRPVADTVRALAADHPDAGGVLPAARALSDKAIAFTVERGLLGPLDGELDVVSSPPALSWAMAHMAWNAPWEDDGPSWYYVTPPSPAWPAAEQDAWLSVFNTSSLAAITVHEVAPGHYAHGRALRRVASPAGRTLLSYAMVEGWAHYAEELCWEEGFLGGDPRYAAGMAIEALIRVTRLAAAIGLHTGAMSVAEATRRFEEDASIEGPAARSEAARGTFDPMYGAYTWGKLTILGLRDEARRRWGTGYTHRRFNEALLARGAPPLGLLPAAIDAG